MVDKKQVKKDADFCKTLMDRLYKDLTEYCNKEKEHSWDLDGHTIIQADIKRLRRELSNLYKELEHGR